MSEEPYVVANSDESIEYYFRHKLLWRALQMATDYIKSRDEVRNSFSIRAYEHKGEHIVAISVERN